jgi:hypothetical protein
VCWGLLCCVCARIGVSNFCAHALLILSPVHQVGAAGLLVRPLGPSNSLCRPSLLRACSSNPCTDARQVCAPWTSASPPTRAIFLIHVRSFCLPDRRVIPAPRIQEACLAAAHPPACRPQDLTHAPSRPLLHRQGGRLSRQAAGEPQRLPHLLLAHNTR